MEENASVASPKLSRTDSELLKCLEKEHSDEQVLKQYSCSWQKESYLPFQGHLYITANFICFYSSFLGREAKIAVRCRDIVTLYKQKTAFVFPNAITISTADKKYTLTSFMSRNHAFRAIQCVWQNSLKRNPLSSERLLKMLKSPGSSRRMLRRGSSGSSDKVEDGDATTESSEPESISDVPPNQAAFEMPSAAGYSNNHTMVHSQSSTSGSNDPGFSEGPSESLDQEDLSSLSLLSEEVDGTGYGESSSSSERQPLAVECKPEPDREQERSKEPETFVESSQDAQTKPLSKRTLKEDEASLSDLIGFSENVEVDGPHKGLATVRLASVDSRSSWQNVWTKCQQLRSWLPMDMFTSSLCTVAAVVLIFVFLLCSLALLCELSLVDPTLQAWLGWQPWCTSHNASYTPMPHPTAILTKSMFKEMVAKYHVQNPSLATSSSQESVPVNSASEPRTSPSFPHTI